MIMNSLELLKNKLMDLNISVEYYEHPAVFTAQEAIEQTSHIPGIGAKNLFLRDKAGQFWLVVVPHHMRLKIRKLASILGVSDLQFAKPEQLEQHLAITPGSVTPLALINDKDHIVKVVLDESLMSGNLIQVHPLRNDMTVTIKPIDLSKFVESCGNEYTVLNLDDLSQ